MEAWPPSGPMLLSCHAGPLDDSHAERLVVAVAKDQVTVADIEQYFAGVTAEGAMAYRKIFEITRTPMALSEENLKALGQRVMFYPSMARSGRWPSLRPPMRATRRRRFSLRPRPSGALYGSSANCTPRGSGWMPRPRPVVSP